jgi:rhodanese-related sulfurtransferase
MSWADDGRLDSLGLPRRHLPLSQWLDTPPGQLIRALGGGPDTPLLFICRSGQRSAQAARRLRQQGHPWPGA